MTQFGYSMAPTLVRWELNDFVDLDDQQQKIVDERLAQVHTWHRQTQVPDYVVFLDDMQARLAPGQQAGVSPLDQQELRAFRERFLGALAPVFDRIAQPVAEVAVTLTPSQLDSIERELQRRNEEARDEYLPGSDAASVNARIERWQKRLEDNVGPLTEKQQALLAARVKALPAGTNWWENRLARQQRTLQAMRELAQSRPPLDVATEQVRALFRTYGDSASADHAERQQASLLATEAMLVELFELATPEQYRHARDRFAGLASDLRDIAGLPEASAAASPAIRALSWAWDVERIAAGR